jgi:hypothetical protein
MSNINQTTRSNAGVNDPPPATLDTLSDASLPGPKPLANHADANHNPARIDCHGSFKSEACLYSAAADSRFRCLLLS